MILKTPKFWYETQGNTASMVLQPLACVYGLGRTIHQTIVRAGKAPVPVICIGNLNAGGSGKTPAVLAVMETIRAAKIVYNPYFLTRGHGGSESGPLLVDPKDHDQDRTGDEALILAAHAPTIISRDRLTGAEMAATHKADTVIMDDGLQNPGIYKDIKFIVINGEMGFGNQCMIPAGPLRDPLEKGLAGADAFILIGEDQRGSLSLLPADKPVFKARITVSNTVSKGKYIAFAGIGYPHKFFNFLRDRQKLDVLEAISFADHHPYSHKDIKRLREKANKAGAKLITTEKDYVRLPDTNGIDVLKIKLVWDDENALVAYLREKLS